MRRALYLAAFDSQLKWCGRIRDELERRGFATEVVVPEGRSALSATQIADAGFAGVETAPWPEVLDRALAADVVVSSLSGPVTRGFLFDLDDRLVELGVAGPVVVAGWVGVIIEKITAGYLDRSGADVVAVNSASDLEHFRRSAEALQLPAGNLLLTGLPFLSGRPAPGPARPEVRTLLFADQPTVPQHEAERRYLYQGVLDYARAHPDRRVLLKPRHRLEEDTFHRMRHHPEVLLAGEDLPPNFSVVYTAVTELLPTVDLLVTVSSTAALEALDHGCRVALVLDLGVHERFGNHVFLDSGLLRTWREISADELGTPDPDWLASYFFPRDHTSAEAIAARVTALVESGERPGQATRRSAYFASSAEYHRARTAARTAAPGRRRRLRRRDFVPVVLHRPVRAGLRELRPVVRELRSVTTRVRLRLRSA